MLFQIRILECLAEMIIHFDAFMEIKGEGIISVISNLLPGLTVAVYDAYIKGNFDEGKSKFKELKKYIDILNFDTNPIPIKAALYLSKIITTSQMRSPLSSARRHTASEVK